MTLTPTTRIPAPGTHPFRPTGEVRPNGEVRPTGEVRPNGEVRPTGEVRPNGEFPVYCDCCPHRPKKMAVIQPDAIQIISRRSGRKHIVRIPLHNPLSRSGRGLG